MMKLRRGSARISFDHWHLPDADLKLADRIKVLVKDNLDELAENVAASISATDLIKDVFDEGLKAATQEYKPDISFLLTWEDPSKHKKSDPLALQVALPLGPSDTEDVVWLTNLRPVVQDYIDIVSDDAGKIATEEAYNAKRLAAALRALADDIEAKLHPGEEV